MAGPLMSTGGRTRGRASMRPMAEINMTPFVDVMLVLLIIFMVTAPLLTVGVEVELPQSNAQALSEPIEPMVVSINDRHEVFIQQEKVDFDTLIPRLEAIASHNKDLQIYVRGDHRLTYGDMMHLMGMLSEAGFAKVALIAEQELPKKHSKR